MVDHAVLTLVREMHEVINIVGAMQGEAKNFRGSRSGCQTYPRVGLKG